jgi:hypothetical protein
VFRRLESALDRLTIFAKGNLDVRDTLHLQRVGGEIRWNGINEVVRVRHPGTVVRVRHETATRSDGLLAATGKVPDALAARGLPLGAYPLASQFSRALFEADADAYVLTIQPEIPVQLWRERSDGTLVFTNGFWGWSDADRRWFAERYATTDLLDTATSMRNFAEIVARLRARTDAPTLVYNVSSVVPGDRAHCLLGHGETLATRIRRFNVALADLSAATGVSIVDVDAIVARGGADLLKLDAFHLTAEGCRYVAEEVVRVLDELGAFAAREKA